MKTVRTSSWVVVLVALTACATKAVPGLRVSDGGTEAEPFELTIPTKHGCPTGEDPIIELGAACRAAHKKALCVENDEWVSWTSTGNPIEKIEPKPNEKKFLKKCETIQSPPSRKCQIKEAKRDDPYLYNVKLAKCEVLDPKIIITN